MDPVFVVISAVWFFIPANVANMTPVVIAKLNWFSVLAVPLDFGCCWNNVRIFGKNKTWRGLIFGPLMAIATVFIQHSFYLQSDIIRKISVFNYSSGNYLLFGFLLGFGALIGDAVKSFFKRRLNITEGQPWIPWDQIDQVIGASLFSSLIFFPPWEIIIFAMGVVFFSVIVVNFLAYWLKFKSVPY